jgi:hypothetical protein
MTIDEICRKYNIENYTINPDGSIDVYGNVRLVNKKLTELPLTFNKVHGNFECDINNLTTLKGSPKWTSGNFESSNNDLTDLIGSPEIVEGNFQSVGNRLTDLTGSPKQVDGWFNVGSNKNLIDPKGVSEKIGREFYCFNTPLQSIFDNVDKHFLYAFNFYKIIKDNTVNLKRLKYVMDLYDKPIDLDKIEKYYRIV